MCDHRTRAAGRAASFARALAALLLAAACALTLAHMRPDHNTQGVLLRAPEAASRRDAHREAPRPSGAVSVNRADAEELQEIRGVGAAVADAILAEREQNGTFAYAEDLLNVRGIGEKTLQKLLPQINLD